MSAARLLQEASRCGASVVLVGEQLKVRAPEPIPDALFEQLRVHKSELIALLSEPQAPHVAPDPETAESDRIEALADALTEKAGAFIGDGIEQAEADRLAVVAVQCRACARYRSNKNNPDAGMGICTVGAWPLSRSALRMHQRGMPPYPLAPRCCDQFSAAAHRSRGP